MDMGLEIRIAFVKLICLKTFLTIDKIAGLLVYTFCLNNVVYTYRYLYWRNQTKIKEKNIQGFVKLN